MTEFSWFETAGGDWVGGSSADVVIGRLAAGALLLKVAHPDVAVQAGAVLDLQPAHLYVAVQLRLLPQGELVARREPALDFAFDGDVGSLEKGLDDRSVPDLDVAPDPKLTFGVPTVDGHVPAVGQLAFKAVVRAERELLLLSITLRVGLAISLHMRALRNGLLCFHQPKSPRLGIDLGADPKSRPRILQG